MLSLFTEFLRHISRRKVKRITAPIGSHHPTISGLCNGTDICQQRIPELYEDQLVSAQKAETSTPALPGEGDRIHSVFPWFFLSGREEMHRRRADPLPSPYGASSSRTLNHLIVMVPTLRKRKPGLSEVKPPYWVPGRERAPGRASASASGKPRAASLGT